MKCSTCVYDNTELNLRSECHDCDGYKNYAPAREERERLDYEEDMYSSCWNEEYYLNKYGEDDPREE